MDQHVLDVSCVCVRFVQQRNRGLRCLAVERLGIFNAVRLSAETGQHRHLSRQSRAQRVDGLDAQLRRIVDKIPAAIMIAPQRGIRQFERQRFVRRFRRFPRLRIGQSLQHPFAHFTCGFFGERYRDDFLGMFHARQQQQVTLDQQFGFS